MKPHRILPAACAIVVLVSCSGDEESGDTLAPLSTDTVVDVSTTVTPDTSSAPTTIAPTAAPPSTAVPTTVAPTTVAPTTAPPTTLAPTTLPPTTQPGDGIVLGPDGVGPAQFGDEPDAAVAAVTAVLGEPTDDSGWVEPFTIAACPGSEYRRVRWGAFALQFSDDTSKAQGRRHFFGWEYGDVGNAAAEPTGFRTSEGIGLGSTVADLMAAHPDVAVVEGEEGLSSDSFEVSENGLAGVLTDTTEAGLVILLVGGDVCGG